MSSHDGASISPFSTSRPWWRVFWIALGVYWVYGLVTAVLAKRAGAPDIYHNEYSRQIALDASETFIALMFLTLGTSRLRGRARYALVAVMFSGIVIALVAAGRLAR